MKKIDFVLRNRRHRSFQVPDEIKERGKTERKTMNNLAMMVYRLIAVELRDAGDRVNRLENVVDLALRR